MTPLDLIRGVKADGSSPSYNGYEFVAVKELIAPRTPVEASMAARNSERQDLRFFRKTMTPAEADAFVGAKPGSAKKAAEIYAKAGMGEVVFAEFGNHPGVNLCAFFPELRARDYNHPAAPRTCAYRAEYGAALVTNPGVTLAQMAYDLFTEGVEPLDDNPPFVGIDPADFK